ncbi:MULTISPECIES: chlorinating enzyme [Streptomyces]|uniref:Chlorinating enzyme n=1 Tax=Streptomyces cyaneofuscatus TaxID=66883 RepID=A0ABZ1F4U4_9ACTN|nr:chlorinating enzyme [Streptomyces cyaneofuscatus]WSB11218.1 chlorinating enzyme [Streptomyces cyaneofuscatus]WSD45249.1 chlorinating enzyme [Streptomyces cyaneofuscatus]WTA88443.1 chlorinating enzyme [Streptomyces cyaneofuscatus]
MNSTTSHAEPAVRRHALSAEEKADFDRNGYFGPFTVYSEEEMRAQWKRERLQLMDRSHAVYGEEAASSGNTNIANYDRHLDSAFLADHVGRPEIVDRVAGALGPDLLCWRTEFFPKYAGDEGTDWHQADTFANASGKPQIVWPDQLKKFGGTLTVWTAFTEASVETGCLQFVPGTHQVMRYDETKRMNYDADRINAADKGGVRRGFFGYDYRELQIDPDWHPDESRAISMALKPGQAVMFWSTLQHASHPHAGTTPEMRLGFASRYVPTCVRIYPDTDVVEEYGGSVSLDGYGAVLVSGEDAFGHNRIARETTRGHRFPRL